MGDNDAAEITISEKMVEEVFKEFERDNPGKTFHAMTSDEFSDRMMKKIISSARIIKGGTA